MSMSMLLVVCLNNPSWEKNCLSIVELWSSFDRKRVHLGTNRRTLWTIPNPFNIINNYSHPIKIPVIYAYPRSGEILVNRCLGSIPDNLILSEVNTLSAVSPIVYQAQHWLNLFTEYQYVNYLTALDNVEKMFKDSAEKLSIKTQDLKQL